MSWHLFAVFFASTFFVSATPGPNMLLAFQYGMNHGMKRTLWTLAGLSTGLFVLLLSTLLGLDVISRQLPWLLSVIKTVGAMYLLYLGICSWRDAGDGRLMRDAQEIGEAVADPFAVDSKAAVKASPSNTRLFRTGVWVSLSNPKAILFFAAFFPKFINFAAPLWPQYVLLTAGLFFSETIWQIVYTLGGKNLASWLDVNNRLTWLNRGCGVIFILIAAALLAEVCSKGMMA